ncbi:hypothetical protein NMY22_g6108 [Coprinellus aureogranulatus]|nr:hypothetical protein NMY22_g6108 [Coprinellus aureogranulatus]
MEHLKEIRLVGVLVQAPTADALKQAGKVAVDAVKKAASGVSKEEVATAVAKAKFAAASAADGRAGIVEAIGAKIFSGSEASITSTLAAFDSIDASAFSKATSSLVGSKPTYVAVGDLGALPYADELVRWESCTPAWLGEKVWFGDQKDWESTTLTSTPL